MGIQHLHAIGFIEALDERVPIRFSRLDVSKLHIIIFAPVDQHLRDQLRAVVEAKCAGQASPRGDLLWPSKHETARQPSFLPSYQIEAY